MWCRAEHLKKKYFYVKKIKFRRILQFYFEENYYIFCSCARSGIKKQINLGHFFMNFWTYFSLKKKKKKNLCFLWEFIKLFFKRFFFFYHVFLFYCSENLGEHLFFQGDFILFCFFQNNSEQKTLTHTSSSASTGVFL